MEWKRPYNFWTDLVVTIIVNVLTALVWCTVSAPGGLQYNQSVDPLPWAYPEFLSKYTQKQSKSIAKLKVPSTINSKLQTLAYSFKCVWNPVLQFTQSNYPTYQYISPSSHAHICNVPLTVYSTLYNVILRIAWNFLETRENIKISTHPFYHINLDWF